VIAEHGLSRAQAAAVHRLDAGTSGVCLIASRREGMATWSAALAAGTKTYIALARGVTHKKGKIARPLREQGRNLPATTRFVRKQVVSGHSLLHVMPEQGRTHQIRKHLASVGHPVLGDARHGHAPSNWHFENARGLDRPFLHLASIELKHPQSGELLRFEAPLAPDLEAVLRS
jgi:23S rRNA-/tRNA-specific pseudouridylate synthase